jgi:nucleotide-binding universal stress UspA family protein
MRSILVPTEPNSAIGSVLQTALFLARRFDSYIEGFALRPAMLNGFVPTDTAVPVELELLEKRGVIIAAESRDHFEEFMRANNVPVSGSRTEGLSFGWFDRAPIGDSFIGSRGRVFDVTVMGLPAGVRPRPRMAAVESSLFGSGRPTLLVPSRPPHEVGNNVVIAWNGSAEQSRTNALALPLLRQARRVTILTVDTGTPLHPTGDDLGRNLALHGVAAESVTIQAARRDAGKAILAHAISNGCDLLIKGAFTQSRLKQIIFGGATRHILENATIPVFMAH